MNAKLICISAPAQDVERSRGFYAALTGMDLAYSFSDDITSYHIPITPDGIYLVVGPPQVPRDNAMCCFFAVDDLAAATAELTKAGGKVMGQPVKASVSPRAQNFYSQKLKDQGVMEPFDGSFIEFQYLEDPGGNLLGLMRVDPASRLYFGLDNGASGYTTGQALTAKQIAGHQETIQAGTAFKAGKTI